MTIVMAFGKFALIHPGHIYYLQEAKRLGSKLVVVVARDSTIKKNHSKLVMPEKQRLEVVKALKPVDEAILGYEEDKYKIIEEIKPDIIALGPDQEEDEAQLERELRKRGLNTKITRIKRKTSEPLHKTSEIIKHILKSNQQ